MSRQINQVNQLQVYQLYLVGRGEQPWQSRDSCSQGSFSRSIKLHCDGRYMLAKLMMVSKQNILLLRRQDCCRWLDKSACWSHKFQCVVVRGDRVVMKSHFPSKVLQYAKSLCGSLCCSCNELIFSLLSFWCTGYLLIHFKLSRCEQWWLQYGTLVHVSRTLKGLFKIPFIAPFKVYDDHRGKALTQSCWTISTK